MRHLLRFLFLALLAVPAARAYDIHKLDGTDYYVVWPTGTAAPWGTIPMKILLPTSNFTFPGTETNRNCTSVVQDAMATWNTKLATLQFTSTSTSTPIQSTPVGGNAIVYGTNNQLNEIVIDSSVDGDAFDGNTLAVTIYYYSANTRVEADLIFNAGHIWTSYNGNLQSTEDMERVALHELGHVIGLKHPDQAGQTVTAIMNSHVSNLDDLAADDIAGAQLIYGVPGVVPANNNFANAVALTLSGTSVQATGSNIAGTKEAGEPNHAGELTSKSIWWKWTATASGPAVASTFGSNFDTIMGVYTGAAVGSLATIGSNDDEEPFVPGVDNPTRKRTSKVSFDAVNGTTYYFGVDGWDGEQGPVTFTLTFSGAVTTAPSFTTQPTNQVQTAGLSAGFTAIASGSPAPALQWQRAPFVGGGWGNLANGGNYAGVTTTTLNISNTTAAMNGDLFRCVATNSVGTVMSNTVTLTIQGPPVFTEQPQNKVSAVGNPVTFTAAASGNPAPTFQWKKDGATIPGATNSSYTIASATFGDAGTYTVVASNSIGSVTSDSATLTVGVAPGFTQNPQSQTVTAGSPVTFTSAAIGTPSPTFQWRKNGVNIPGATNSSYTIASTVPADAGAYSVTATNVIGSAFSNGAVLTVNSAPAITTQPQSQTIVAGNPVTFTAAASGTPTPTFQWRKNGVNIGGATNNTYTIASVTLADAATYTVVATNSVNSATSNGAVLTVHVPPLITTQPQSQTIIAGNPVTFIAAASGTPAPTFQWTKDGTIIPGATNANYTIPTVARADAGAYGVIATNAAGSVYSNFATLTVQYIPVFTAHPPTHFVTVGANVTLTVTTDANPAATYQWKKNNVDIPGATNASFTINSAQLGDTASYTVVATNVAGSATSNPGVLTVTVASITPVPADFNNDGKPDIVWRNINTGAIAFWFMNGTAMQSATVIGSVTSDWSIAGTGDFNNDGQTDLLWRKASTGGVAVWLMNGTAMQSAPLLANITADWRIDGTGDFNGDGKVDILWRKESSGAVALWLMDGIVIQSTPIIANITADWLIGGTGDFNGDNKVDILWRKESTGAVAFWLMDGVTISSTPVVANITADWKIAGSGDYNADGETDILWRKESTGLVAFWLMNDTAIQTTPVVATITADWVICN